MNKRVQLKRELIRVNITIETDEDDLIGGFRLVNGETVWHNGPVIEALQRGAVLLLDEIDLASNKILCLQSILEGKGLFLKKTGQYIAPAKGFQVFATANTKGKGSDDGRFIGTNVLNEAFLERFPVTFEQSYPTPATEQKILEGVANDLNVVAPKFCKHLVDWADIIRKTFYDGGIEEIISTVVWFTSSMPTASLLTSPKQLNSASIALMMRPRHHSLNSMTKLMLILRCLQMQFLLTIM